MKRLFAIIVLCLLLCGCGTVPGPEVTTAATTEATLAQPTEPSGSYDPGSTMEIQTDGGVRAYSPDIPDAYGLVCMGEDVVIFSGDENTTLTKLSGQNLYATAAVELDCFIYPESNTLWVTEKGIAFYDEMSAAVVMLDTNLKETGRVQAPADLMGEPILSANRHALYYCTADSVRVMDLETGISKLLKQITSQYQTACGLLLEDTVLECSFYDGDSQQVLFISTEDGSIVASQSEERPLTTEGTRYFCKTQEGSMYVMLWGEADGEPQLLLPRDMDAVGYFLEGESAAVTAAWDWEGNRLTLDYYDLDSGLLASTLTMENVGCLWSLDAGDAGVCVLVEEAGTGEDLLYRWDVEALPSGDETVYTDKYYTRNDPDTEGLAQCQADAAQLGARYGLEIWVGDQAVQVEPWDYDLETEYQVPLIRRELDKLEDLLAQFPEDFFRLAAEGTSSGVIKLSLVRKLSGSPESGSLDTADGIQFWEGEDAYICLTVGDNMERTFYHELFHVVETRILSQCTAFYDWNSLNPRGFDYDYDYIANQDRTDSAYTTDENRYFIDTYSMSFPKEDRARIMEFGCMADCESYFQSAAMQKKLRTICQGIREAFGLQDSTETFIWEQYLSEPLAPAE